VGGHPRDVCARVGGRGRHRALRCRGVVVRARRRVRAMPDLRQRAMALRAAPGGDRSRLPGHVRRPDARSEDAAAMSRSTETQPLYVTAWRPAGRLETQSSAATWRADLCEIVSQFLRLTFRSLLRLT